MIVSHTLHPKLSPNSLGMVIVGHTNSGQVELTVECFDLEEMVLFKLFPIVHVF